MMFISKVARRKGTPIYRLNPAGFSRGSTSAQPRPRGIPRRATVEQGSLWHAALASCYRKWRTVARRNNESIIKSTPGTPARPINRKITVPKRAYPLMARTAIRGSSWRRIRRDMAGLHVPVPVGSQFFDFLPTTLLFT
jgi:hypothetical protein